MKKSIGSGVTKLLLLGAFALLAFSFGGCASATRVAIAPEKLAGLGDVKAIAAFSQPGMNADIRTSNISSYTGGGLIPALIDAGINNSRTKTAAATVSPIRSALADFDLGEMVKTSLQQELSRGPARLTIPAVEIVSGADEATLRARAAADGKSPLLILRPTYCLTHDFGSLSMSCLVWLQPASSGEGDAQPLYRNFLGTYQFVPEGMPSGADPAARIGAWSANHGALARQALNAAAQEIARLLAFDLARPGLPSGQRLYGNDGYAEASIPELYPLWTGIWTKGRVEKTETGRTWVRVSTGALLSFRK